MRRRRRAGVARAARATRRGRAHVSRTHAVSHAHVRRAPGRARRDRRCALVGLGAPQARSRRTSCSSTCATTTGSPSACSTRRSRASHDGGGAAARDGRDGDAARWCARRPEAINPKLPDRRGGGRPCESCRCSRRRDPARSRSTAEAEFAEDTRLRYRFLDLRREKLHGNIVLRAQVIASIRRADDRRRASSSSRRRSSRRARRRARATTSCRAACTRASSTRSRRRRSSSSSS